MKKVIFGTIVVILGLGICAIVGLIMAGPAVDRAFNQVETKNVLAEYNIPMSPDLIFQKKEENPKGGNLNKIPMFNVEKDFQWDEAGMSFVDTLQASEYTIFQFVFRKKDAQLSNPDAATAEGIRDEVVDFYLDNLLKSGWALVILPVYEHVSIMDAGKLYLKGETAPLVFQNSQTPSQLLILDYKRGFGKIKTIRTASIEENKGQEMPVYWMVLYTNPKITKPLPLN